MISKWECLESFILLPVISTHPHHRSYLLSYLRHRFYDFLTAFYPLFLSLLSVYQYVTSAKKGFAELAPLWAWDLDLFVVGYITKYSSLHHTYLRLTFYQNLSYKLNFFKLSTCKTFLEWDYTQWEAYEQWSQIQTYLICNRTFFYWLGCY